MENQVCFRTDYFVLVVTVAIGVIIWVIYKTNEKYEKNTDKLKDMCDEITEKMKEKPAVKEEEEPTVRYGGNSGYGPRSGQVYVNNGYVNNGYVNNGYGNYGDGVYQLIGYVYPHRHPDQMFRLMGRRYNSYKFEYYVIHPYTAIKIPIKFKNDMELSTGDRIDIPGFHGHYIVHIYDTDRQIL
jgi:hypothetical protein